MIAGRTKAAALPALAAMMLSLVANGAVAQHPGPILIPVDGPYLNEGLYLSSNAAAEQGGVALTFYESTDSGARRAGPEGGQ